MEKVKINEVDWSVVTPSLPDETIKNARLELKLTQMEVAEILGLSVRQYQKYENGEKELAEAPFQVGIALCELLHLDPYDFVDSLTEIAEFDFVRPGVYEEEDKK